MCGSLSIPMVDHMDPYWVYERMKSRFEENIFYIEETEDFGLVTSGRVSIMKKSDIQTVYKGMVYWTVDHKKRLFLPRWYLDTDKRRYKSIDYLPPPMTCPQHVFNLWMPENCRWPTITEVSDGGRVIQSELRPSCTVAYFLDWLVHAALHPGIRVDVAIVIVGCSSHENRTIGTIRELFDPRCVTCMNGDIRGIHPTLVYIAKESSRTKRFVDKRWIRRFERYVCTTACPTPITNRNGMQALYIDETEVEGVDIKSALVDRLNDCRVHDVPCERDWIRSRPCSSHDSRLSAVHCSTTREKN